MAQVFRSSTSLRLRRSGNLAPAEVGWMHRNGTNILRVPGSKHASWELMEKEGRRLRYLMWGASNIRGLNIH